MSWLSLRDDPAPGLSGGPFFLDHGYRVTGFFVPREEGRGLLPSRQSSRSYPLFLLTLLQGQRVRIGVKWLSFQLSFKGSLKPALNFQL